MKIKKRRKYDIERFRRDLLSALDAMDPDCEFELNSNNGSVNVKGDEVYPQELVYYRHIEVLIDKRDFYQKMSKDALAIVNFICLSDTALLEKLCGSKKKKVVTAKRVAKFFRGKWGRVRTREAMDEIKKLLSI